MSTIIALLLQTSSTFCAQKFQLIAAILQICRKNSCRDLISRHQFKHPPLYLIYRVSDRANFYFWPLYLYSLCDTCFWEPWSSNAGLLNVFYWLWICGRGEEHTVISVSKNRCQLKTWGWGAAACPGHGPGSRADVVITINNRNASKQKARFIPLAVRACSGCRCPSVGGM